MAHIKLHCTLTMSDLGPDKVVKFTAVDHERALDRMRKEYDKHRADLGLRRAYIWINIEFKAEAR